MKFVIEIQCDNDAFQPDANIELSYLLPRVSRRVEDGEKEGSIQDTNGQTVGSFRFEEE
jgi:hypothetical protein